MRGKLVVNERGICLQAVGNYGSLFAVLLLQSGDLLVELDTHECRFTSLPAKSV